MSSVLPTIHEGMAAMPAFSTRCCEHDLLESFVLDIELDDRSQHRLTGFYTINEERLGALDAGGLGECTAQAICRPIYMASLPFSLSAI